MVNYHAQFYVGKSEEDLTLIHDEVTAFTPQAADLTRFVRAGQTYVLQIHIRSHRNGRPIAPPWAEWCDEIIEGGCSGAHTCASTPAYIYAIRS